MWKPGKRYYNQGNVNNRMQTPFLTYHHLTLNMHAQNMFGSIMWLCCGDACAILYRTARGCTAAWLSEIEIQIHVENQLEHTQHCQCSWMQASTCCVSFCASRHMVVACKADIKTAFNGACHCPATAHIPKRRNQRECTHQMCAACSASINIAGN
jgi:hypothetical protein